MTKFDSSGLTVAEFCRHEQVADSTDHESLLPYNCKRSHPEAIRVYRQEERRDKADRKQVRAARRRLLRAKLAR